MGRRGPVSDPNGVRALKQADGCAPTMVPKPKPVVPRCPSYLSPIARREWRRIVPELDRLGLLTCVDGAALEAYCNAYSNMVAAQTTLNKMGATFVTEKGYIGQRPDVAIVRGSMIVIRGFCAEFGLSPSARARMAIPGKSEDEDEMDTFLRSG